MYRQVTNERKVFFNNVSEKLYTNLTHTSAELLEEKA